MFYYATYSTSNDIDIEMQWKRTKRQTRQTIVSFKTTSDQHSHTKFFLKITPKFDIYFTADMFTINLFHSGSKHRYSGASADDFARQICP